MPTLLRFNLIMIYEPHNNEVISTVINTKQ